VKPWEIIADRLSKAGWSLGWVSAIDSEGRTIWIVDAHRDDGRRFIVHADEKHSAFVELERQVLTVTFYLAPIHADSRRLATHDSRLRDSPAIRDNFATDFSVLQNRCGAGNMADGAARNFLTMELIRFACPSCGQHISATRAQIDVTAPCPNCKKAVIVPRTSTLPLPRPMPLPVPLQAKFQEKKRYETTVILIDDSAAVLDNRKKLTKWTDDFTDARNWLIRELEALHGEQYFAGIFDHMKKRPVLKEKGQGRSDVLRLFDYWFNR
jgi:hypothetical protein